MVKARNRLADILSDWSKGLKYILRPSETGQVGSLEIESRV